MNGDILLKKKTFSNDSCFCLIYGGAYTARLYSPQGQTNEQTRKAKQYTSIRIDRQTDSQTERLTPVPSRFLERFVFREFFYTRLILQQGPSLDNSDQFAFRPSASTTAAVVAMLHTVRAMLIDNDFVHVFSFDFSKAFDTVRHTTLTSKY